MAKQNTPAAPLLYDDRIDIGVPEWETIVQGLVWLGDVVYLPAVARPSSLVTEDERRYIGRKLSEFAEAGFLRRWDLETDRTDLAAKWWPTSSLCHMIERETYRSLSGNVNDGIERFRDDVMRGAGRKAGEVMSGITEFVSLRDALWTMGLARELKTDSWLSSNQRLVSIRGPLTAYTRLRGRGGPIARQVMELNGITGVSALRVRDVRALQKRLKVTRTFVRSVETRAMANALLVPQEEYLDQLHDATDKVFAGKAVEAVQAGIRGSEIGAVEGIAFTTAGIIFPPLAAAAFAQPLFDWNPHGREGRQLVMFLRKLKRRVRKAT